MSNQNSTAYSMCSQDTKDQRKRKHEEPIMKAAAGHIKDFENLTRPRDSTTGELVDGAGSWKNKPTNPHWREEVGKLGAN